jgi:hypothetical protein
VTPLFNGFFSQMERTFNYGFKDPDTWWDLTSEPSFGIAPEFVKK